MYDVLTVFILLDELLYAAITYQSRMQICKTVYLIQATYYVHILMGEL